mgnify:CR=1 FL=1
MKEIQENNIQEFKDFISNHQYFYVIGHKEPDGDCIASCLGIADILKKSNKEYKLLSAGPFKRPEIKKFEKQFSNKTDFLDNKDREITGLIILDCSELSRLGEIDGDLSGLDIFVIDHHKHESRCGGVHHLQQIREQLRARAVYEVDNMPDTKHHARNDDCRFHTVFRHCMEQKAAEYHFLKKTDTKHRENIKCGCQLTRARLAK